MARSEREIFGSSGISDEGSVMWCMVKLDVVNTH